MHAITAFRHFHSSKMPFGRSLLNRREIHLDKGQNGIARISFSEPGGRVNLLTLDALKTLGTLLIQAREPDIKALVVDIDNLAGADLKMIRQGLDDPILMKKIAMTGHRVFYQLSHLRVPTFALISNACLGGGLELALACNYRVVTDHPRTILGLPEVRMGLIPCWGGTQRLPRLVGGPQALNMILNGDVVSGAEAREIQLADAIFSREMLKSKGEEFVKFCLTPEGKKQVEENRKNTLSPAWTGFTEKRYETPGILACQVIYGANDLPLTLALAAEMQCFLGMPSEAKSEARYLVSAFLDKKSPFSKNE